MVSLLVSQRLSQSSHPGLRSEVSEVRIEKFRCHDEDSPSHTVVERLSHRIVQSTDWTFLPFRW